MSTKGGRGGGGAAASTAPTARIYIDKTHQGADNIGTMKGLSSEIVRLGLTLLVQTQEMGGRSCYIETLVYHNGRSEAPIMVIRTVVIRTVVIRTVVIRTCISALND